MLPEEGCVAMFRTFGGIGWAWVPKVGQQQSKRVTKRQKGRLFNGKCSGIQRHCHASVRGCEKTAAIELKQCVVLCRSSVFCTPSCHDFVRQPIDCKVIQQTHLKTHSNLAFFVRTEQRNQTTSLNRTNRHRAATSLAHQFANFTSS